MIQAIARWNRRRRDPLRSLDDSAVLKGVGLKEAELDRLIGAGSGASIAGVAVSLELTELYRSALGREILPEKHFYAPGSKLRLNALKHNGTTMKGLLGPGKAKRGSGYEGDFWLLALFEGALSFLD